jgi:hypothetical protein
MGLQMLECTKLRIAWNGVSLEKNEKESLQCLSIIQPSQSGSSLKGFNNLQRSLVWWA